MPSTPLTRLRAICLRFPEAHEVKAWGEPTFRVRNKMFAMYASADTHHGAGHPAVWCNATLFDQDLLVRAHPRRFFVPAYVGPKGWVGIRLDGKPNWDVIRDVLSAAYRKTAPRKLAAQVT